MDACGLAGTPRNHTTRSSRRPLSRLHREYAEQSFISGQVQGKVGDFVQGVKAQGGLFVTITAMQGKVDNSSKSCALLWIYSGTCVRLIKYLHIGWNAVHLPFTPLVSYL